jgi:hypothetical protein
MAPVPHRVADFLVSSVANWRANVVRWENGDLIYFQSYFQFRSLNFPNTPHAKIGFDTNGPTTERNW